MNKKIIFLIIAFLIVGIGIGIYLYNSSNSKNNRNLSSNNYNSSKLSINNTVENNSTQSENSAIENKTQNETSNLTPNNIEDQTSPSTEEEQSPLPPSAETEIASYTTKIRTKDSDRQTNINLTCSSLDNTIVRNGDTFSFCKTVGKSTESKGYEEAKVFQDGKEIEALGGGKCQVSSTLYNAVLKIPELDVTERHPHSGEVYYVPEGKDAAVAYGSYDFKFVNNTGKSIKIKASCSDNEISIKILSMT